MSRDVCLGTEQLFNNYLLFSAGDSRDCRSNLLQAIKKRTSSFDDFQTIKFTQIFLIFKRKCLYISHSSNSHPVKYVYPFLCDQVTSVKYRNWLNALCQFSQAQLLVSSISRRSSDTTHLIPALCEASAIVYDAMNLIKVCTVFHS